MKYVVIGESAGATREAIMAVYPHHKQLVDKFIAQGVVLGIGLFVDGGNMAIFKTPEAKFDWPNTSGKSSLTISPRLLGIAAVSQVRITKANNFGLSSQSARMRGALLYTPMTCALHFGTTDGDSSST